VYVVLLVLAKILLPIILQTFHGFRRESRLPTVLKDAVAHVFGWDRTMLEGRTKEAREWREQVDPWWAERLNMPNLTPRWVSYNIGALKYAAKHSMTIFGLLA
jgi:hypothetical protein